MRAPKFLKDGVFWTSFVFGVVIKMLISEDRYAPGELSNFVESVVWALPVAIFLSWYRRFVSRSRM